MAKNLSSLRCAAGILSILICWGCETRQPRQPPPSAEPLQQPWLADVAAARGLELDHVRADTVRYWFPEIMSGGAAWIDFDADGDLDLYVVQGGTLQGGSPTPAPNRLFENDGSGHFRDVTMQTGTGDEKYGMGCAVGDYDNDGDEDLYVTNVGPNTMYRNNGDGTFSDVTSETGTGHAGWGTSAGFADIDGDGDLDLYVVNYVDWAPGREIDCFGTGAQRDYCHPSNYDAPAVDVLYRNDDGIFRDITKSAGIADRRANGLGLVAADLNSDGRIDFYVANDGDPNQLWLNLGENRFSDAALQTGAAVNRQGIPEAGMGVVALDLEHDGDLDLFMTHLREETNTFYRNESGLFADATARLGLAHSSVPFTGFGTGAVDFDHDGLLDLFVANGRVGRSQTAMGDDPFGEPNQLFRGTKSGFEEERGWSGKESSRAETSRAAAFGDMDGDGDVDIVVVNNGGPVRLLENRAGAKGNWIRFRVELRSGRHAEGAKLRIVAGGIAQWRPVTRVFSYLAANETGVHFGLGSATAADSVRVIWPGGSVEAFRTAKANAVHTLQEGQGM